MATVSTLFSTTSTQPAPLIGQGSSQLASAIPQSAKPWVQGLSDEQISKQQEFHKARARHSKMNAVVEALNPLLVPHSESNIIAIVGATGVGKSTLASVLSQVTTDMFRSQMEADPSAVCVVGTQAKSIGDNRLTFKGLYQDLLVQLRTPPGAGKALVDNAGGRLVMRSQGRETIQSLRDQVEAALTMRKTRVCFIDEAYHLLSLDRSTKVLDTLKSLSDTCGCKFLLLGSFDLFDLLGEHGQVARRTSFLLLDRYHLDNPSDCAEFRQIVKTLQSRWPVKPVPNFAAISDDLLDASLGCVGLLKSLMLDCLAQQLVANGAWNPIYLRKAAKSSTLRGIVRDEIRAGELKVRDALVGESLWDEAALAKLAARMEASNA